LAQVRGGGKGTPPSTEADEVTNYEKMNAVVIDSTIG